MGGAIIYISHQSFKKFVFYLILRINRKNTFIDLFGFTYYLLSIPSATVEKTEVLHNSTDITKALMGFYAKINSRYDYYGVTSKLTLLTTESCTINRTLLDLKNEGVRLRHITEIRKDISLTANK